MHVLLRAHERICLTVIQLLLRLALLVDGHRRRLPRRVRQWRGALRRLYARWLLRHGLAPPPPFRRHRPWNRTPDHLEQKVIRLHVEQPHLGAGQLRMLAARVLAFHAARETFRRILIRRQDLVTSLRQARRRRPKRIRVGDPCQLWGADLTLVFVLGVVPVWILGVVDYHGSRLVALERLRWGTSEEIARVLAAAIAEDGAPERLLTDRGPAFRAPPVATLLAAHAHDVRHVLTLPAHPWTNGRIERIFRTFKETVFSRFWLFASIRQVDRFCADFLLWHNRDRPHGSWDGRTPDEVFFHRDVRSRPLGRVAYFDGRLLWYRFG
ncbi:MAG TPA: integrase core domain-containing protein [Anaeromyxobacteraceae bacterium]|nr:integrase core domain-containing protein [Anaeromyxobacteraceae bacterium]